VLEGHIRRVTLGISQCKGQYSTTTWPKQKQARHKECPHMGRASREACSELTTLTNMINGYMV
jgi:hypothetical protein